jgi:hypothetical protein
MKRLALLALVACALLAGLTAGQGSAASGGTAAVYRNTGHDCASGATNPFDQVGHFTSHGRGATLYGTVELDTVAPFSSYPITLVQTHPCVSMFVGTLRTDSHGFGTLSFQAPMVKSAGEDAFVLTRHNDHRLASGTVFLSG